MACPHNNVQQFTEVCLDCGANIYETEEERVERLRKDRDFLQRELRNQELKEEGDRLEAEVEALRPLYHKMIKRRTK